MLIGEVVGTIVASQKNQGLEGRTLLIVENLDNKKKRKGSYVVAVDSVGAGQGEIVLYASGSSARQTEVTNNTPCDAVIMGIVDNWTIADKTVYQKD